MPNAIQKVRRSGEAGYSLLMAVFLVATSLVLATAVTPVLLTEGRRERETETIWRGEQYQRAIGLYFRKFGKYPTKIDDLVKQTNGVRFLRQAYTDPMNKQDGSWRFIYVGPNGQLIGSLRQTSMLQSLLSSAPLSGPGILGGGAQGLQPGATSGAAPATAGAGFQTGAPGVGQNGQQNGALAPNSLESQPQPLETSVIGGNIIGVGSKIKTSSFRLYQGADTYQQWEFIWNPNPQLAVPGQNSANPTPPPPQTPDQNQQTAPVPGANVPGQAPQVPSVNPPPTQ